MKNTVDAIVLKNKLYKQCQEVVLDFLAYENSFEVFENPAKPNYTIRDFDLVQFRERLVKQEEKTSLYINSRYKWMKKSWADQKKYIHDWKEI